MVESLTSYIVRLAQAHSVSVWTLLVKLVFSQYGREYLLGQSLRRFWTEQSRALNGIVASTRDFVRILENLTLRTDLRFLTILTWADVLPSRGLLRPNRAWCPVCYAEWRETGQIIYEPLLWTLEVITLCPRHRQMLLDRCDTCHQQLHHLAPQQQPGHCSKCGHWLGIRAAVDTSSSSLSRSGLAQQIWIAEMVGELLAQAPLVAEPPPRQRIGVMVSSFVEHLAGDNNAELARQLGLSKYSIRDCRRGDQLLRLGTLLDICQRLDVSLFRLLTDDALLSNPPNIVDNVDKPTLRYQGVYRRRDRGLLQQALQKELAAVSDVPSSMSAVAERLGYDLSYLTRRFPDECQKIKERYEEYTRRVSQELHDQLHREVREVMQQLHAQGIYPSQKRVAALISRSWFFWLPEGRATWRAVLHELKQQTQEKEVHTHV